jgi:hypothetical protein
LLLKGFQGGGVSAWQLDSTTPVVYNFTKTVIRGNSVGATNLLGKGGGISFFGAGGPFYIDMNDVTCIENWVSG